MRKKSLIFFALILSVLFSYSVPAYALDVSLDNARVVNNSGSRAFFSYVTPEVGSLNSFSQAYVFLQPSHTGSFYIDAYLKNSANNYFYLEPNTIFVYYMMTDNMVWRSAGSSDSTTRNAGCKEVGNAGNYTTWECYAINYDSTDSGFIYISNQWERAVSGYAMEFTFGSWTQYKSTDTDYTSILNSINSNTSATASNLNSLSSLVDALKTQTNNNFNRQHDDIVGFQTQTNNNFNREHDDITALSDRMNRNFNMLDGSVVAQGEATQQSIDNQTEQQAEQYEHEKEEESQREQNIQNQANSAQINAQVTPNPFEALFGSNDCITLSTISGWFNATPAIQVCSPYPATIRPVLNFVTSSIMVGLLIRLYYKKMNGGYNG